MPTSSPLSTLRQKLTALGVETLELLKPQKRQGFAELITSLSQTLLQLKGEASSVAIAEEILHLFEQAANDDRKQFFRYIHAELRADAASVNKALADYQAS